uniref:L1 transposable element RRM domain-containing protein n=1 Tax=Poecilia formosa TaxID=48698 RepID=A0A087XN41_POEFO
IAMKNDIMQDLNSFKSEMNKKLEEVSWDFRNLAARLTEAEQRVNELETVNMDLRDSLSYCLKQQKNLLDKVTDLERRSRHNIRIHGIEEEAEGNAMQTFIANFLKEQLSINQDLQIQRAHRSLAPKTSILVNFHRYDIKEKILKAAWGTIFYDDDLPTEINNKLKEYRNIKKILKEGKIRFQTAYPAKMRIHWSDGPNIYTSNSHNDPSISERSFPLNAI